MNTVKEYCNAEPRCALLNEFVSNSKTGQVEFSCSRFSLLVTQDSDSNISPLYECNDKKVPEFNEEI